jgi:hypothetical protein
LVLVSLWLLVQNPNESGLGVNENFKVCFFIQLPHAGNH